MKKFILAISSVVALAACNSVPDQIAGNPAQEQVQQPIADTTGLASFRAWKVQNELTDINEYAAMQEQVQQPVRTKAVTPKRASAPVRRSNSSSTPVTQQPSSQPSSNETAGSGEGTGNAGTGSTETAQTKKEGISKAAKGAVIGGVAGAAGGAVINKKNRVVGAVVGAVIGAGGGYVIGRKMDKKDGRIELN